MQWDPENKWNFDYKACLPYVDIFLPNEAEILALTQKNTIEEAIKELTPHTHIIALKLGKKGSLGIQNGKQLFVEAFNNPIFVDAIGAGDSFNSGFIAKFMTGAPLQDCLKNGNLMGALNTTAPGGTTAFKNLRHIQEKAKSLFNTGL